MLVPIDFSYIRLPVGCQI